MVNAKEELLKAISGTAKIKCASIVLGPDYDDEENRQRFVLKINYSEDDYQSFLVKLNFKYDNGYGGQQLFGAVWLEDGTWLSRGEYDGSEWWNHNVLPTIPPECI
jgi:hypothetical protein